MKKITLIIAIVLTNFSCNSYVEDVNEDPYKLKNASAKNLIQGVILADQFFHTSSNLRHSMIWMNQATGEDRQYIALNNWNNSTSGEFDEFWNLGYVNVVSHAQLVVEKTKINRNPRLQGVAEILIAHAMGTITSLWGDVPYSQVNNPKYPNPVYEPQAQVYENLQKLLDQAIENLGTEVGEGIPSDKDIIYEGNTTKWIKLAHSLKARYYLHVKNYTKAKMEAQLGIDSSDGDYIAKFSNTYLQSFNPSYSFLVYDRYTYMSGNGYAAELLDPSSSNYRGNSKTIENARFAFNFNQEYFSPYTLNIFGGDYGGTNGKFGSDSNVPLVTYGEMLLIIAEADARTSFNDGLNSYNKYRELINTGYSIGIKNNGYDEEEFSYLPYETNDFANGGIENPTGENNQIALLREIYEERYIYFIANFESFTDFRRTNNLANIKLKNGFSGKPERFPYPQIEINGNTSIPNPIPSITTKTPIHK